MMEPIAFSAILIALVVFGGIAAVLGASYIVKKFAEHDANNRRAMKELISTSTHVLSDLLSDQSEALDVLAHLVKELKEKDNLTPFVTHLSAYADHTTKAMEGILETLEAIAKKVEPPQGNIQTRVVADPSGEQLYTREQLQKVITWAKLRDQQRAKRMEEERRRLEKESKAKVEEDEPDATPLPEEWYGPTEVRPVEDIEDEADEVRPPPAHTPAQTTFDRVLQRASRGKEGKKREPQED